jgi:hypothetical protein
MTGRFPRICINFNLFNLNLVRKIFTAKHLEELHFFYITIRKLLLLVLSL